MVFAAVEAATQRFGREIFARLNRSGPTWFTPTWFDDRLMGLTMSEEALKVQLFRFVDTLPQLNEPTEVTRHLREYLDEARSRLPWWLRAGIGLIPHGGLPGRLLSWTAKKNAERLARRFIAGSNVAEAIAAVAAMRRQNLTFTIDLLGEATITEAEAELVQRQYLELLAGLGEAVNAWPVNPLIDTDIDGPIPRVNVSVKLSALYSQFDPIDPVGTSRVVRNRLRPILRLAKQNQAFVNFDMEQYAFKDTTLRIFREILTEPEFRDWPNCGIAIQAYLRDTEDDLRSLCAWAKERGTAVTIRLVKGAYWDYETVIAAQNDWPIPVWTRKWESDAAFERCTRLLMENHRRLRPAFGSHNIRSIANALATAEELGVHPSRYEFQMLYGMADAIKEVLVSMRRRVRIYTPYGRLLPGMAYLVRRLLENTSNDSFLRAGFVENIPEEQLLMNPTLKAAPNTTAQTNGTGHEPRAKSTFRNEPLADFSKEPNRLAMAQAIAKVRTTLGKDYPAIINGQAVTSDGWITSINPNKHAETLGRVTATTAAQAEEAILAAAQAFPMWRDTPATVRAECLRKAAALMRERRWELSAWVLLEAGKPWREADADIAEAIDFCEYYAHEMLRLAQPRRKDLPGEENETIYEPRGVAIVIAPWNFPLAILCGMTVAALVTGNTVIMKPAEQTSIIAAKLMEILQAAGVPDGVVHFVPGIGEEIGPTLVHHRETALIAFTGSMNVGLLLNRQAAITPPDQHQVKRVIAEMGGKNAIIVDADADLDEAVKGTVDSAFGYAGQKCSACSRVIVLEALYDQFLSRLIEATKSLTVAPAEEPGCSLGAVIDEEARARIGRMIEKGKAESRLVYAADPGALSAVGSFVGPHIFADVAPSAAIAQEEIFGPVLAVLKARDLEHALEIANGTRFALTGGIFSRSPKNLAEVKRRFRVGNLYVNRKITGALVERQPFGGFKMSGIGSKAGGPDYLLQFVVPRTITENTMRRGFAPTPDLLDDHGGL